MKRLTGLFLVLIAMVFSTKVTAQNKAIQVINFKSLAPQIKASGDSLKIINFWATWCRPCVEELKYFKAAADTFSTQKVKFVFVSLDFKSQKEKVEQFWAKNKIKGAIYLLDDDPNKWINQIDSTWTGEIPYTLIIPSNSKTTKLNGELKNYNELQSLIINNLTK